MADFEVRALPTWPYPDTTDRLSSATFRAGWEDTVRMLRDEAELLGAREPVLLQLVCEPGDVRRDGMLRARAQVWHPGVIVTLTAERGSLVFATDQYEQWYGHAPHGWHANVRAIAFGLQALRAVDRYGITRQAQQYAGFRALPAAPADGDAGFVTADQALDWMRRMTSVTDTSPKAAYRAAVRGLHPDTGGTREQWDRLEQARILLEASGWL